ncbi:MAG: hypothetical protein AAGJ70_01815 [Pseudomonadota bacterium]
MGARRFPHARHVVQVQLTDEEMAAVNGWRQSRGLPCDGDALRVLALRGLLQDAGRMLQDG